MKKFILLFCLYAFTNVSNAQSYTSFPENVALWDIYDRPTEPDIRQKRLLRYTMKGDTLINGKSYNKIYCSTLVYTFPPEKLTVTNLGYCFGIRQDIATKRVYRTYDVNNSTIDTLLYDFDLKIGDTVTRTFITRPSNPDQVVISIDSVTFYGKKYKRFHLKGTMPDAALIEGIGSVNGLIEYNEGSFESAYLLDNFCNSDHSDCSVPLALNVAEINNADKALSIYPNPFSDELYLNFKTDEPKRKGILIDLLGKEIRTFDCSNKQSTMKRGELKDGAYFLKIINGDHTILKKVIVQ